MKPFKDSSSDGENEDVDVDSSGSRASDKKHKKHKHKRHKKKKQEFVKKGKETPPETSPKTPKSNSKTKLKIKLSNEVGKEASTPKRKLECIASPVQKYVDKISQGLGLLPSTSGSTPPSAKSNPNKKRKTQKKDSETSSEEERWLDAIQSGKLDEVDEELKKIKPKDPKLMTARQRAMLERKTDKEPEEQLMALPSGYKEVVMTAEAMQRKAIKSQKRKQKADEKREKDKKKTMDRLLKKQESKAIKLGTKKVLKRCTPQVTYRDAVNGPCICIPAGFQFPLAAAVAKSPPPAVKCVIANCSNLKKFSCSKTGAPLCSLVCYKKNISAAAVKLNK